MELKPDLVQNRIYQPKNIYSKPSFLGKTFSNIVPLARVSKYAKFFGVTDAKSIQENLINHGILVLGKQKEGDLKECLNGIEIDGYDDISVACRRIFSGLDAPIQSFKRNGAARLTFYSELFGQNGEVGAHTIGLVYDQKSSTLYVLDSINESFPRIDFYKKILKDEIFSRYEFQREFPRILFSTKPQQQSNEYTCNNWAVANIEAVKEWLNKGNTIKNSEELNNILPNDINKILEEQYYFVMEKTGQYSSLLEL